MREILFRGKLKTNGEWVEGDSLVHSMYKKGDVCIGVIEGLEIYGVIPETVGQYTGLTDKNGTKVFEGDIVKTQSFYDRPYSKNRKSKQFVGVVEYKIRNFGGNNYYPEQNYHAEWGLKFYEDFGKYTHYSWGELWNCEVIGNIHDNPELLGGAENG